MFQPQMYLNGLAETVDFFSKKFENMDTEELWVAHVTADLRCLKIVGYDGSHSSANVSIRAIVSDALNLKSAGIILAHNHSNDDPTPGSADRNVTSLVSEIASELNFTLLDHLIFGGRKWTSMRRSGLL